MIEKDLDMLKAMQQQLVEKEKLAALGSLVAGVAHEVNTPIGVAMTSISACSEEIRQLKKSYQAEELSESEMDAFFETVDESMRLAKTGLDQAARLISSFKMISVDQNIDDIRLIDVCDYLRDIIRTFQNQLKKTKIQVELDCPQHMMVKTYPGSLSQIMNNLLSNVINHAYEPEQSGIVHIQIEQKENRLNLLFEDYGKGMDESLKESVFQPFITTARNRGGSGLGLNIVYNLVVQRFSGEIEVQSKPGEGSRFIISLVVETLE
ncbi:MAG: HAMP domain-containing histidine kinase [Candidatus Thiodiazotropha sp. (ex Lucina aurantia)]|nr:HAMP domain-containing histidine kinase [Candidatus Thiodiazotropha sp. (ex Lucina pensylvanica)]MBT3022289.1 HAMP domain-containing histidine kinase [Candidatus Thiodiazotropha taylori]MBV2102114.1 HAMP domain-containing histidine kinase [Candidatus Thiodiazotropha sp. (ex Lucina aurantia)]MBV2116906.1 HAMP domain-containing histidine kinase [Candidatus Thiodiazotropha sp. (ex Lucina aurantia)]